MAAPKRNRSKEKHQKTLDAIRATQLLKRLSAFALNKKEKCLNKEYEDPDQKVEMSSAQVTAALGLIKKVVPDLSAVTHSGDDENPVAITAITLTAPNLNDDD
jgi:hypothetical protein